MKKLINNVFRSDSVEFFEKIDSLNSKLIITSPTYYSNIIKRIKKEKEIIGGYSKKEYVDKIIKLLHSLRKHLDDKGKIVLVIGTDDDSPIKSIIYLLENSCLDIELYLNMFKEYGENNSEAILVFEKKANNLNFDIPNFINIQEYDDEEIKFGVLNKDVVKWFIEEFTKENDLVIDPLVGVGTSILIAKDMKRNFIGVDIDGENINKAKMKLLK